MQAWIQHAFIRLPEDGTLASPPGPSDLRVIRLFVEFYSLLARDTEGAALIQLNRGRRALGFLPIKSDEHFKQALTFASASAPVTRSGKKKLSLKDKNLALSSPRMRRENRLSPLTKSNRWDVPRKTSASRNMEKSQGLRTVKSKRKRVPDETDGRPHKKRSTVNSANELQRRAESSNTPHSHSRTVAIWRPKNRETVHRPTRNTKLPLPSVQLDLTTQIQKKKLRNLKIGTVDDQHTSRAKQEEPYTPRKRPASPNISLERKRRAIGNSNAQSVLGFISSQPDDGPAKRTSRPPQLIVRPSVDWGQQSDITPLSSGAFSVFSDMASLVEPTGSGTSFERQSLGCLKREPDSKPGQEAADKLEENFENTSQERLSRESIPREMQQSPAVSVITQGVQENSLTVPEPDDDLPNEAPAGAVANLQGPSVFNDGEFSEKRRGQGKQDADTSQVEVINDAGIDTKVEFFQGLIPLVAEDIVPWMVMPEQESQLLASFGIKAELASVLPPLQLPMDPIPQMTYKVPLADFPPIWAQVSAHVYLEELTESNMDLKSRQEVCESFDWFRSYQGGVYHVNEMAKGYLLSGFPSRYVIQNFQDVRTQ